MSRQPAIAIPILLGTIISVVVSYELLPKQYAAGERLSQATVFWHEKEAFIFLDVTTTGRFTNFVQKEISALPRYRPLPWVVGASPRFLENQMKAYRLLPSGELTPAPLPLRSASFGYWTLHDGNLQLLPPAVGQSGRVGFRWDGSKFVRVRAEKGWLPGPEKGRRLGSDDLDDEVDTDFLTAAARRAFKAAGWHYKQVGIYSATALEATLPLNLARAVFNLKITLFPLPIGTGADFDLLASGAKSLELSPSGAGGRPRVLWSQKGWQTVSQDEFERCAQHSGRTLNTPMGVWVWCAAILLVVLGKLGSWGSLFLIPLTSKRRVLKGLGTSYAFPPATPAQFPQLDTVALDRYTEELERLGFVRLLDFSLVSDAPNPTPTFCRLLANTRHHCFGEISQIFQPGKPPLPLKCSIKSSLEDDWTLAFSDRKPRPASSLLHWKRALGVSMPEAAPCDLWNAFLEMRSRMCQELGIAPLKDDTPEAYFAKMQHSLTDMREAVKQRNFATAIPRLYWRKFSLLKTKPEYVWLGDYPKEAERRRQGFIAHATAV